MDRRAGDYHGDLARTITPTPMRRTGKREKEYAHPALAQLFSTPQSAMDGRHYTPVFSAPMSPPDDHGDWDSRLCESSETDSERAVEELLDSVRRARKKVIAHAARSGSTAEDDWVDMVLAATPKRRILFDGLAPTGYLATPRRHSDAVRDFHPALRPPSKRSKRAEWRARMQLEYDDDSEVERDEQGESEMYDLHTWREVAAKHAERLRNEVDAVDAVEYAAEASTPTDHRRGFSTRRAASPPAEHPTSSGSPVLSRTQRLAQRERRMGKIIKGFLANALVSRVLAEWASFTRLSIAHRAILVKTAARLRHKQLKIGVTAWAAGIAAQREEIALQLGAKVLIGHAVVPKEIVRGWNLWRSFTRLQRAEKNGVLRKIMNRQLHTAFASWQAQWAEKRRLRWLMLRTVSRLNRQFIYSAVAAWSHHTSEKRRLKSAAKRIIQRLRHQLLCVAMSCWSTRAKASTRTRQIVQRVVSRMTLRRYARAFDRWACFTEETARIQHVLQKVVLRIKRLQISTAWTSWMTSVKDGLRLRHAATCVVKALQHGMLSSAMAAWSDWAYKTRKAIGAANVLAKTLANLPLYRAFNAWRSCAFSGKLTVEFLDRKLDQTVLQLQRMRTEKAFELWYGDTWKKHTKREWASKVVKHVMKLKQAHACKVWNQWANRQARVRRIVQTAAHKLKRKTLGVAMLSWVSYYRTMKLFTAKVIRLWCNQKRAVFVAWCEHVRCGFHNARMRKRVLTAFRKHWQAIQLRWIYEMWGGWATRRRALRQLVLKVIGRMMRMRTALVYKAWYETAHIQATARRAIRWMLHRTTERRCARSISEWRAWMVAQRRTRASMTRVARARLELVLRMWRSHVVVLQRTSRLLLRNCGRHLRWAFTCWTAHTKDVQHFKFDLSCDVLLAWRQQTVAALHQRQSEAAAKSQQALQLLMTRRVVSLFAHRWEQYRNGGVFTAWAAYAAHRHNKRTRLSKAKHKMVMFKRKSTISVWRAWVLEGGRLWNVSSRRQRRVVRACLDAWRVKLHRLHVMRGVSVRWKTKSAHNSQKRGFNLWVNCVGLTVTVRRMYCHCMLRLLRGAFNDFQEGCARVRQYKTRVAIGLRRQLRNLKVVVFSSWLSCFRHERSVQHHEHLWRGFRRVHLLHKIFHRWPMYLQMLRTRQKLDAAQAAHAADVAATHKLYAEKEELVVEEIHAKVEAAHLAASRLLRKNTLHRVEQIRFRWAWKHWQQIWYLARVERDRTSLDLVHSTTVAVQRTRAERDRMAYEQKLREVAKEARRAEKWAHELQRAGCPLCDSTATVVGQTRVSASAMVGGRQVEIDGGASRTWAGHLDDPAPKHHLHPARSSVLVDSVPATVLAKGSKATEPPDVPRHHLILLK